MKTIQFRCKLLSDVILSQKTATEGNQESLSFIPGNNFLGIVAQNYAQYTTEQQVEIFHHGHVRFSDAHPVAKGAEMRSLHIPAALYYPKLSNIENCCYVNYFHDRHAAMKDMGKPEQLKQCRLGFYTFKGNEVQEVTISKSFSIKSAYDRELRRSSDSQMFGYESIEKDTEFLFSVEVDDEKLAPVISQALVGTKHIGRSKTAQYGLVEISTCTFGETPSTATTFSINGEDYITVYADGRLIFMDENGEPTFRPTAQMLGLEGEIDWEKTQVRTFQYAPWNGKRQTRDSDRVGFEKGSVFVVKVTTPPELSSMPSYVGCYQNEGFGKVIYGWKLLQETGKNGLLTLHISKQTEEVPKQEMALKDTPLLRFLAKKQKATVADSFIYEQVNQFVKANKHFFNKSCFASQWGSIRTIALQNDNVGSLVYELFDKKVITHRIPSPSDDRTDIQEDAGYITHGIKAKEWKVKNRADILKKFIIEMGNTQEFGDISQRALVNLASEMAKKQEK